MKYSQSTTSFFVLAVLILRAITASAQWAPQNSSVQRDLYGVHFIDENTGVAVGEKATIIQTSNGGLSWSEVQLGAINDFQYSSVTYITNQTGFITGYKQGAYKILKTNNGVTGWFDKKSDTNYGLNSIAFRDQKEGVAVGDAGLILLTHDGGNSFINAKFGKNFHLHDAAIVNSDIFVAGQSGKVFKSPDLGGSWFEQTTPLSKDLNSIQFLSNSAGYAAGNSGVVLKTINGGQNWASLSTPTSKDLNDLYFVSPQKGFAVGEEGVIIATVDGGATWNKQIAAGNFKATLNALSFPSNELGYAVGNIDNFNTTQGIVKKYDNPTSVQGANGQHISNHVRHFANGTLAVSVRQQLSPPFYLQVFNAQGQRVCSRQLTGHRNHLHCPVDQQGIYFYHLTSEQEMLQSGKFLAR